MNMAQTGGGIILMGGSTLRMNGHSSVRGNTSVMGGGIYADNDRPHHLPDPTIVMNGSSSVRGNTADVEGGGIALEGGSALTMNDSSSVHGNHATDVGGGIWRSSGTVNLNDASSVRGNSADHGEDDIAMPPEIDRGKHLSEVPAEAFAGLAILILGAIGAGALLSRPWLRATALATITGIIGIMVFTYTIGEKPSEPGREFIGVGIGWFVGVMIGALLAGAVSRLRAVEWPSDEEERAILGSAVVVLIVLPVPAFLLFGHLLHLLGRLV
jgi:hypothetical protein